MEAWTPPSEFEEYRLVRVLGHGAMGTVWLAHDLNLDRAVAIKLISASSPDAESRERFFVEARAVARLHHPNVVTIHRVGEIDGHPYLVSEYVRGTTLDRLPRPVAPALGFDLALGLARGLAVAHRHGVLHRDIKPANAILTVENEVKLLDFGLAKLFEHPHPGPVAVDALPTDLAVLETMPRPPMLSTGPRRIHAEGAPLETDAGTLMGTPAYLAPEMWLGQAATPAADVYALGVSLFHLLTGRLPHEAASPMALAARVAAEDAAPLRSLRPECPAALAEVVDACLRRDVTARLASGEAVREALELRARAAKRPPVPPGNPYRGLAAFTAEHRHLFFGRDLEIADILEGLRSEAWVVVAGRSGAGKSSLVRAGVLPRILEDGSLSDGGPATWRVLALVPGARPRGALVAAAAALLGRDEAELARALDEDAGALARQLRGDRAVGTVVLIDQLEELATVSEPEERAAFVEVLRHLLVPAPGLRLIATLRSDYVGHLEALGPVHRELTKALYVLGPMTPEGLRDAVLAPAAAHDVSFEAEEDVHALVAAVEQSQGSLPLVEFALAKLWEQRDEARKIIGRDALARIGGVEGALSRHADEVIAGLSPPAAAEAHRLLMRLVTAERTRARRTLEELQSTGSSPDLVRETLEALVRGRLLTAGEGTFEVAHEALIADWTRLRLWLDEEQGVHQTRERLEVAAADWERLGRRPDALWIGRRLDELAELEPAGLSARERAFADASRAADRRRRWTRRILLVAAPTAIFSAILGANALAERRARREAADEVARAQTSVADATAADETARARRREALVQYAAGVVDAGRLRWRESEQSRKLAEESYDSALQHVGRALTKVAAYGPARRLAADIWAARLDAAEERIDAPAAARAVVALRLHDEEGRHRAVDPLPRAVEIATTPPGATVRVERTLASGERTLIADWRTGPVQAQLAPGTYLISARREGSVDTVYSWALRPGGEPRLVVPLRDASTVPEGYVYVPGGELIAGTTNTDFIESNQGVPAHWTRVAPFLIRRTESTNHEWLAYLRSLSAAERKELLDRHLFLVEEHEGELVYDLTYLGLPDKLRPGEPIGLKRDHEIEVDWRDMPAANMSGDEARAFARWSGARFCTEEEWELAARGADGRVFPQGDVVDPEDASYAFTNGAERSRNRLWDPVGAYPRSRSVFGVDDLAGNMTEWTATETSDGLAVLKSGSWDSVPWEIRADFRKATAPKYFSFRNGIRLCHD